MDSRWFKNTADKDRRKKELASFRTAFSELGEILKSETKVDLEADFESPSWAYKQAYNLGYNKALTDVLNLIKETK